MAKTFPFAPIALAAACAVFALQDAQARITRMEVTASEKPTFGGYAWPEVGQYEKIAGKADGEVNPADPKNRLIVDINLAPKNERGNVEYSFDFYILKPIDLAKGAHKVMYEPPNRGGKTWSALARVSGGGNDPGSITDPAVLANPFLMPRGYTMVWSGWDKSAGTITGPVYDYIVTSGAAPPLPQSGVGFPSIPGVTYTGLQSTRYLLNFGPDFYTTGIATINPPVYSAPYQNNPANGPIYPSYVPRTDSDGNDIAGVWANDGCEAEGQYIPFAKTRAERLALGDPRPSVEERYPSFGQYHSAVMRAIDGLVKDRLMLCEDADDAQARLLAAGLAAGVPGASGKLPAQATVPHCLGQAR